MISYMQLASYLAVVRHHVLFCIHIQLAVLRLDMSRGQGWEEGGGRGEVHRRQGSVMELGRGWDRKQKLVARDKKCL